MMSSGISGTGRSVVSPVVGSRTSNTRLIATFQMQRSSKTRRMVSMLSGTPLWSRTQTRTGASVPTSATARPRVAVARRRFSEQARQHLADRVGVADREGVEGVRLLEARGHHEVDAENVVLAPEAAGKRQHFGIELIVRLAVHQHEAGGVGQRIRQERYERRRLARSGGARHARVLAAVL